MAYNDDKGNLHSTFLYLIKDSMNCKRKKRKEKGQYTNKGKHKIQTVKKTKASTIFYI